MSLFTLLKFYITFFQNKKLNHFEVNIPQQSKDHMVDLGADF